MQEIVLEQLMWISSELSVEDKGKCEHNWNC